MFSAALCTGEALNKFIVRKKKKEKEKIHFYITNSLDENNPISHIVRAFSFQIQAGFSEISAYQIIISLMAYFKKSMLKIDQICLMWRSVYQLRLSGSI